MSRVVLAEPVQAQQARLVFPAQLPFDINQLFTLIFLIVILSVVVTVVQRIAA